MGHCGGSWQEADVYRLAYQFNCPPYPKAGAIGGSSPACGLDGLLRLEAPDGLFLETIKASDCRSPKTLVIRLFEGFGGRGTAKLVPTRPVKSMILVDALEQEITAGKRKWTLTDNNALCFEYHPFEIITVKVVFQ